MSKTALSILLVDDEEKFLHSISERLKLLGYDPIQASSGREALQLARENVFDLAIVDLKMPDMDGLVTIAKLKEIHPELRSVLLTGHGSEKVKQATEAMDAAYFEKDEMADFWRFIKNCHREGNMIVIRPPEASRSGQPAADATGKMFPQGKIEILPLPASAGRVAETAGTDASNRAPAAGERPKMVGETLSMQNLRRSIKQFAALDCSVIIYGETGVGKELAARIIHDLSPRRRQRFMAINCGCFSNDLLIEELFGSGKTDASSPESFKHQTSCHEPGGTLLLDQIEDMSPTLQLSLLKIIDRNKKTCRDDDDPFSLDIRIFAASRHNLDRLVKEGKFREELYYRLNIVELTIPPLRERRDDILPLCSYFLNRFSHEFNKRIDTISEEVISLFMSYDFPGNVRELEHVIERAVILTEGHRLEPDHLPERFKAGASSQVVIRDQLTTLAEMEKQYILHVLEAAGGNKSKTAEILGISRAALWRKLKQFKQDPN